MRYLPLCLILVSLVGCDELDSRREIRMPVVRASVDTEPIVVHIECDLCNSGKRHAAYIPEQDRHHNYGGGSCVYASLSNTLEAYGMSEAADHMRQTFSGGADYSDVQRAMDYYGYRYVMTTTGDTRVLDFADRTGRCAEIFFKSAHACAFLGYDSQRRAVVLDPNHPHELEFWNKDTFVAKWRSHGGHATVILETPLPARVF